MEKDGLRCAAGRFSPKEIRIFDGVLSLLSGGADLHSLRVSDIAAAAGVGKGTVYEYFKSKEEIIEKTVVYKLSVELARTREVLEEDPPFFNALDRILDLAAEVFDPEAPSLWSLVRSMMSQGMMRGCVLPEEAPKNIRSRVYGIFAALHRLGVRDGVLREQENEGFVQFAFRAAFSAFVELRGAGQDLGEGKENARRLIERALG